MSKPSPVIQRKARGFTLVEIIVTLVVAAILGTFLVTFMSSTVTRSAEPVIRSKQLYALQGVMENVKSIYLTMVDDTSALTKLRQAITGGGASKDYGSHTIDTQFITFTPSGGNYVESSCSGSGCALKVTVSSNVTEGLSVTQVFTQRP